MLDLGHDASAEASVSADAARRAAVRSVSGMGGGGASGDDSPRRTDARIGGQARVRRRRAGRREAAGTP